MSNLNKTEPRSIWHNLKVLVQSTTDAATYSTHAVSTVAQTADSLAQAGLILAQSNEELVKLDVMGEHQEKLTDLYAKYPALEAAEAK